MTDSLPRPPDGSTVLLESDGLSVARRLGLATPETVVLRGGPEEWSPSAIESAVEDAWEELSALPADRVVVKAQVPGMVHKFEAGLIRFVPRSRERIVDAVRGVTGASPAGPIPSVLVQTFVPHVGGMAGEVLLGVRLDREFGWVVTLGPGGTLTEFWSEALGGGGGAVHFSPSYFDREGAARLLRDRPWARLLTEGIRGEGGGVALEAILDLLEGIGGRLTGDRELYEAGVEEVEFNPVAFPDGVATALDAVVRVGGVPGPNTLAATPDDLAPPRDLSPFLAPRSVAVAGVSARALNPGRIILRNTLAEGFPSERLRVVKPGGGTVDGCACVDSPADPDDPVDLLVLAIPAGPATDAVEEVCRAGSARGIVLIPGGLGETEESVERVERIRAALDESRRERGWAPAVNGGNCLGVRSADGPVNTLFIPGYKLPRQEGSGDPVGLVSQSGAFAVARVSALAPLDPRVVATVGNQLDVTAGEYVRALARDPRIEIIAVYVEGFVDGDGLRLLEGVRAATRAGKDVVLYRAGRSRAGKEASASHTASIAGEYEVTGCLVGAAGAMLAETLEDFDDLVRLAVAFRGRSGPGEGLVAVSNAGFECVAMADHAEEWALVPLGEDAATRVAGLLVAAGIGDITRPANPLDLTPMMGADGFAQVVEAMLEDPSMACGVVGCVPLTAALDTLPPGEGHGEDLARPDGLAARLGEVWSRTDRPWVAVVDSGPRYDPFARALAASGLPVFRYADRAVRALGRYVARTRA